MWSNKASIILSNYLPWTSTAASTLYMNAITYKTDT
jgi:hypothetical protein